MKKSIIILLCTILGCTKIFAQEDPQFTLFPWASLYYNAGAAGEQNNTLCFTGIFKQQSIGLKQPYMTSEGNEEIVKSSPQQILANIEFYSRKIKGAFGLSFIKDKDATIDRIGIRFGYAYKLNLGSGRLGIGLQLGFLNRSTSADLLRPIQDGDPVIDNLGESYLDLDFNFGLHYKAERWFVGLSATQLLGPKSLALSGGGGELKLARHMYISGGYIWTLPWNPSWTLEPQALIKTNFSNFQLDLMVLARYNGILWAGASYRIQDAVSVMFGARPFYNSSNNYIKGLDIGVSYSFSTTKLAFRKNGSFGDLEVMVRYCFDIYRQETFSEYGSSRYLYKNQY